MRKHLTRKRLVVGGIVLAVVVAIAAVGAVSRSTSDTAACTPVATTAEPAGAKVPTALWYWTMAVSPTDPRTVVLGTSSGLYRSTDGGKTWTATGPKNVDMTSVVADGGTLLAGGVTTTPTTSPVIRVGIYRAVASGAPVLVASTDGGKTWKPLHPVGLPHVAVQAMAVDPSDPKTLYLVTNTGRFFRSTDGARSFTLLASKIGIPAWAVAITQGTHFVGGDMDSGAHQSVNGTAWSTTSFTDPRCTKMVMEYAVQPGDTTKILMTSFGIVVSTDGGKSWHPSLKSSVMFGPVAWSKTSPATAYAVDFDGLVWRTADGGQTWKPVA
jgi:photosystem II stability/assembly factor-like uncharacterized protein